ncbi:MAG: hypothetical protein U0V48_17780 [Anaerolineales bacterium]
MAQKRGIRVITHEVGLQPASAFFTDGEMRRHTRSTSQTNLN